MQKSFIRGVVLLGVLARLVAWRIAVGFRQELAGSLGLLLDLLDLPAIYREKVSGCSGEVLNLGFLSGVPEIIHG